MIFKVLNSIPSLLGLGPSVQKAMAERVFVQIAETARQTEFYSDLEVPDTVEGRFDMVSLHMTIALERIRETDSRGIFGQALFDVMVSNLDANFREMGVGDTKVGAKVRELVENFMGRGKAYREALDEGDEEALTSTLSRNIYGQENHPKAQILSRYLTAALKSPEDVASTIYAGKIAFPALTEFRNND